MAQNDYAVVVGISTYPDLGSLGGPANDALDFYNWLLAADGGNVPRAQVTRIVSPAYANPPQIMDAEPQIGEVEKAFQKIALDLRQSGQQAGRLYVYLAGHGFSKEVGEAALLMANAVKGLTTNLHIAGRAYAERFSKSSFFREVVLLMDCCREDFKMTTPRPPAIDDISGANPAEIFYGFATTWSRASREGPWGNNNEVRGIFTLALLAGLRGGAKRDANGQISRDNLATFISEYVQKSQPALAPGQKQQNPSFNVSDLNYQWLFNPPAGEAPCNPPAVPAVEPAKPIEYVVRIPTGNGNAGTTIEVRDVQQIYPVAQKTPNEWTWRLGQGFYKLTRSDGFSKLFEVGGAKETIDVTL